MYPENTIVDCFGSGQMILGVVTRPGEERLQIEDSGGRLTRLAASQVLTSYGPATGPRPTALALTEKRIQAVMAEIDGDLLWTDWLERGGEPGLASVAQAYFGNEAPESLSAVARFLNGDTLHFQRQGREFVPRTQEGVEEMQQMLAQRAAKAAFKERRFQWLAATLAAPAEKCPLPVPEEMESFVQQSLDYLLLGFYGEWVNLLSTIRPHQSARESAIQLLHKVDRMPADVDEFLLVNGIHAGFTQEVLEHADSLPQFCNDETRLTWSEEAEIFSIDDASTREIDDALSIERRGEHWLVGIHLANPSAFVKKDDCLDQAAVDRPLSLYLPTTTVMMFPDQLGTELASLNEGQLRPAISFRVEFAENGEEQSWDFQPTQIRVRHHLTYDQADKLIAEDNGSLGDSLRQLYRLSDLLRANREACGGVSLNRPEMRVSVHDGEITVYEENQETPSHRLVQEFMILANHLAAKYALRNDVPIIYRTQDEPSDTVHPPRPYNPAIFDQEVRKMRRTRLSTYPQCHAGLGLDLYTQVSSPLRRYADLVIQRQLAASLCGQPLPYSQEELFGVLDNVEKTSAQNRSLEREARHFWILEYLRRNCLNTEIMATVVKIEGQLILAEIDSYYERGILMSRDRVRVGERCLVRITDVKPKVGRMTLSVV